MDINELKETSSFHKAFSEKWTLYQNAYSGTTALIESGILSEDIDRDPLDVSYREKSAWGQNLSEWIVNIIADFVGLSDFEEDFSAISKDWALNAFINDCNMLGTNWDVWWSDIRRAVYATGMNGIIVDKGKGSGNDAEMKANGVYPYVSRYSPLSVLNAIYERDPMSNRPFLSHVKLLESNGTYKFWYQDYWELYKDEDGKVVLIDGGENPLGEIPFVWHYNLKDVFNNVLGVSDIVDIARNDVSIIRLTADMAQITNAAAFLMLARPKSAIRDEPELKVGPNEQITFDADNPGGTKPFWLTPDVSGPINAILEIIAKQEMSAIRSKNLNAVFSTMSADARSGDSIKQALKFLEAMLNRKVSNEIEARQNVMKYWLMWQGMEDMEEKISISHSRSFDVGSLLVTIADALTAKTTVRSSDTFLKELDKIIVKKVTPDLTTDIYRVISDEIDAAKVVLPDEVSDFKDENG